MKEWKGVEKKVKIDGSLKECTESYSDGNRTVSIP